MQILRRGKNNTRIRRLMNHVRSWSAEGEQDDTNLILDDDGVCFEQHSHNPRHATYLTRSCYESRLSQRLIFATWTTASNRTASLS